MNQQDFLVKACAAAELAEHVWPEYAACEAALESAWGSSALAAQGNNLFGQKQSHPPVAGTQALIMPTKEFLHGEWVTVQAEWVKFVDWQASFAGRMHLLHRLSAEYPHYAAALAAKNGEEYVAEVSKTWSTDPGRADKVLEIYRRHFGANGRIENIRAQAA